MMSILNSIKKDKNSKKDTSEKDMLEDEELITICGKLIKVQVLLIIFIYIFLELIKAMLC
jgi:flagellar biogenesis protein FliO